MTLSSVPDLGDPFTLAPPPGGPGPDTSEIPDPPPEKD